MTTEKSALQVPIVNEYTWQEFKDRVYDSSHGNGDDITLYRGQGREDWNLTPSVARESGAYKREDYFSRIVPHAHRLLSAYLRELDLAKESDLNRFVGILQHHGFPTPLLDWTTSPYIAMYFAASYWAYETQADVDWMTVWTFNAHFAERFLRERQLEPTFKLVVPDARDNPRLLAQDGMFTMSLASAPLDLVLAEQMRYTNHPGLLQRINVKIGSAHQILRELNMMGIHEGTLFPGLEGACRRLKHRFYGRNEHIMTPTLKESVQYMVGQMGDPPDAG